MKRDLRKWLTTPPVKSFVEYNDEDTSLKTLEQIQDPQTMLDLLMVLDIPPEELIEFIWCQAQKQFLKDLLDDLDISIEKTWKGKNHAKNESAQFIAYEASVKNWLYNKYHYLKRKNHV